MHASAPISADEDTQKLKIVIVGHVDHGKSTLIGRLLFDTHSLPDGKIEQIRRPARPRAWTSSTPSCSTRCWRSRSRTSPSTRRRSSSAPPARNYVIIDAPGHKEFLKNMITGAASADAAVVLLDAQEGLQEQTRRHGYLLSLLGVKQVLVAVNKMDLVDFSQEKFEHLEHDYRAFLEPYDIRPLAFIPMSAKHGHNIVVPSEKMPWFSGDTLLARARPPAAAARADREAAALRRAGHLPLRRAAPDRRAHRVGPVRRGRRDRFFARRQGQQDQVDRGLARDGNAADARATPASRSRSRWRNRFSSSAATSARIREHGPVEGLSFSARVFWLARRAAGSRPELHAQARHPAGRGAAGPRRSPDGFRHARAAGRDAPADRAQRGGRTRLPHASVPSPSTTATRCRRRAASSSCRTAASAAAA